MKEGEGREGGEEEFDFDEFWEKVFVSCDNPECLHLEGKGKGKGKEKEEGGEGEGERKEESSEGKKKEGNQGCCLVS